jgi:VWFA-related protein
MGTIPERRVIFVAPDGPGRWSTGRRWALALVALVSVAVSVPIAAQQQATPVFRAGASIVSVDVIVRDAQGNVIKGLTQADFTVLEDGKPQPIETFTFQQIADTAAPAAAPAPALLGDLEAKVREDLQRATTTTTAAAVPAEPTPMTSATFAGRRLIVLLFDVSSMQPEDVQRAVDSATDYVDRQMSPADLVSLVTIGSTINVLTDFTSVKEDVHQALAALGYSEGTATPPPSVATAETDETAQTTDETTDDTGFEEFNNDVRLRALKTIAETLGPIEQKKAILYFSAGMQRNGDDNQVELRAAINASVRGNVAIYPIDSRGLQAVAPGGDASRGSRGGVGLFSGQNVRSQFQQLTASQDSLTTLAADTGGRAFTDSNDFGEAFSRAQRDLSAYYLIGYSSSNAAKDGRFRKIEVRVSRKGARLEARAGYYAERDFAHTNRQDREGILDDQLAAAVSLTDLPVVVGTGWFRQTADRFYVPIALAVPGSAVPPPDPPKPGAPPITKVSFDVRGVVRDEQGRTVGRIRDTLDVPAADGGSLAGKLVLYQSGVTLPPGRFSVKVVVRENASGTIGTFEAPIAVPLLRDAGIKVSPPVISTQLQPAGKDKTTNPLVRDGVQLLPNLTRLVARNQNVYFYYEVYDPALTDAAPDVRTSLAFYRGNVKVYETPVVERTMVDDATRKAVLFELEVPAAAFTPGTYTCQVNVIDAVAGKVAFPRLAFQVK